MGSDTELNPSHMETEGDNARAVIAMLSGQETYWDVILKLKSVSGPPATASIFLGMIPECTVEEAKAECRRRWPRQYKGGLTLKLRPATV